MVKGGNLNAKTEDGEEGDEEGKEDAQEEVTTKWGPLSQGPYICWRKIMTAAEGFVRWWFGEVYLCTHRYNMGKVDYYISTTQEWNNRISLHADSPEAAWESAARILKEELLCRMNQEQTSSH